MADFVISPPPQASVAVRGSARRFPVRRIFCVGRNYAEHAREMGDDPDREPPFFFTKPADAVVDSGAILPFPRDTANLHHEAELVVAIGTGGADIAASDAESHIWGYGAGNDLTRRDLQSAAKKLARPWDFGKAFDRSAIIGPISPASKIGHPETGAIALTVNGEIRQSGDLAEMIWPVDDIIAHLTASIAIAPGDLIMTGTPAGVGPLNPGETCTVTIGGLDPATVTFAPK